MSLNNEYNDFIKFSDTKVPLSLDQKILSTMKPLLEPSPLFVFAKIFAIHSLVGMLSLSVCHQFGMNPFGTEISLDQWFMAMWGHHTCMVICGVLFTSLSFIGASLALNTEQILVLRKTQFLQVIGVVILSLMLFSLFGAELVLSFTALWLAGSLIGGFVSTELLWWIKKTRRPVYVSQ